MWHTGFHTISRDFLTSPPFLTPFLTSVHSPSGAVRGSVQEDLVVSQCVKATNTPSRMRTDDLPAEASTTVGEVVSME